MKMNNNNEDKFNPLPVEEDDPKNRFSSTRGDVIASANMWYQITNRAHFYMMKFGTVNEWFGTNSFYNIPDHESHGFALRIIDLSKPLESERSRFRNEQWNMFLEKANNVFAFVLYARKSKADATEEEVQNLSADRMQGLIKRALVMLFDAHNPDKGTLEDCLKAPERDDIRQSIAHATFSR